LPNMEKAFQDFAASLEMPGEGLKAALEKSEQVSEWIKSKLKVNGTFPGGSYRRGTGMPLDSLKLHLVLSQKYYYDCKENSIKLLMFLKNRLPGEFGDTLIGKSGQVVRIKTPTEINLDLVPSIKLTKGGYLTPNGHGGWFKTNPDREEAIFENKEEASSGRFKKLAKIMKAWNLYVDMPFNPYFLELVVYYRVNDFAKLYAELVHSLFASMRLFLPEFLNCPAVGEVISSGASAGVRQEVVEEAYRLTSRAMSEIDGEKAVLIWQSLLGEGFS